jgi:hypothetical protein
MYLHLKRIWDSPHFIPKKELFGRLKKGGVAIREYKDFFDYGRYQCQG